VRKKKKTLHIPIHLNRGGEREEKKGGKRGGRLYLDFEKRHFREWEWEVKEKGGKGGKGKRRFIH